MATLISLYQIFTSWFIPLMVLNVPLVARRAPDMRGEILLYAPEAGLSALLTRWLRLDHLFWLGLCVANVLALWLTSLLLVLLAGADWQRIIATLLALAAVGPFIINMLSPRKAMNGSLITCSLSLLFNILATDVSPLLPTSGLSNYLSMAALAGLMLGLLVNGYGLLQPPRWHWLGLTIDGLMLGSALLKFALGLFQLLALFFPA